MKVLARIQAGVERSRAVSPPRGEERAAVLAQRFRVYQRKGYYRPGLQVDRDVHDDTAAYFLATLPDGDLGRVLLGSARLILGESRAGFRFPARRPSSSSCRRRSGRPPSSQRVEVSRVVAEAVRGIVIGGLLAPLGLIQAMAGYTRPLDVRAGLAVIKLRLLRALQGLGVRLHEIQPARLIYPKDGPIVGLLPSPPGSGRPVYWLTDEIVPSIEQAIALYDSRYTASPARSLPTSCVASTRPESTEHTHESAGRLGAGASRVNRAVDAPRRIP